MLTSKVAKPENVNKNRPKFWRSNLIGSREGGTILIIFVAILFFTVVSPRFVSIDSFQSILGESAIVLVVAAGMAPVIISRQIDLSVGAILGVAAYGTGLVLNYHYHPLLALGLSLILGMILGCINGLLITRINVPAMIVTLGTASIYRGLLFLLAPKLLGYIINPSQIPQGFRMLSSIRIIGIPFIAVIALVVAVVVGFLLSNTLWGRNLYAIGSNPEAARFAGIDAQKEILRAMILVGILSGLAGFLFVMRYANVYVRTGSGMEFSAVAGVVVGGIAIFGGSGRILGAVLGVLLLNTFQRGFIMMNIPEFWKDVATGIAIVVAITLDAILAKRRQRLLRWERRPHLVVEKETIHD